MQAAWPNELPSLRWLPALSQDDSPAQTLSAVLASLLGELADEQAIKPLVQELLQASYAGHSYIHCPTQLGVAKFVRTHAQALAAMPQCHAPLVQDGERLYLWNHWANEVQLAHYLRRGGDSLPLLRYPPRGATQFRPDQSSERPSLTAEQEQAVAVALQHRLTLISGGPGSGKTTTMAALLRRFYGQYPGARCALLAPTGRAAARLRQAVDMPAALESGALVAQTVHRFLGWNASAKGFASQAVDMVVVDESSMLDLSLALALFSSLPGHCKIVLLGDANQLAAVELGSVFAELCQAPAGTADFFHVRLPHSHRFTGSLSELAQAILQGDLGACQRYLGTDIDPAAPLAHYTQPASWIEAMLQDWEPLRQALREHASPGAVLERLASIRVLCATHQGELGTHALNERIARSFGAATHGWFHGRVVMMERNDYRLGLFNGDTGIALQDAKDPTRLRVHFAPGETWFDPRQLQGVSTAFACSIHRSQGNEFERVWLALPDWIDSPLLNRELFYTGVTRARARLAVCASAATLAKVLQQHSHRRGSLLMRLQEPPASAA